MKSLDFHPSARRELDKAITWYNRQQHGLGLDLLDEVMRAASRFQANPLCGTQFEVTIFRFVLVQRFPYAIYYLELDDTVWVSSIAHGRRRPGYWLRRKPPK